MITYLADFTETERGKGGWYKHTSYSNKVLYAKDEKSRKAYSPDVQHDKLLTNIYVKFAMAGKRSAEEMIETMKKAIRAKKKEERADFRELLGLRAINTRKLRYLFDLYRAYKDTIDRSILQGIFSEMLNWSIISPSPYSCSFYSTDAKNWDYTPEDSYRISDHWNFYSGGQRHCIISDTNEDEKINGWMLCQFRNGKYHIVKTF